MSDLQPLVLHGSGHTVNPWKVVLVIEELGLPYKVESHEFGDLKKEPFVKFNPNGRVPALIDPNQNNLTLWESGAIIDYLIDTYDKNGILHYTSGHEKYQAKCWEHFQMSGQGPYWGQKAWFDFYHPEKVPSAVERYSNEIRRTIQVIDKHLADHGTGYLVGDRVTYADLMFLPWCAGLPIRVAPEIDTSEWAHYNAWLERLLARPVAGKVIAAWKVEIQKGTG